jgi:hypothetical protein
MIFDNFSSIQPKECNIFFFCLFKTKDENLGFYAISSWVGIDFLPPTITELHKILITCIHLNDNIISYPPNIIKKHVCSVDCRKNGIL